MKPGAVLVDVAIDQGGCFETSRADHPRRADLRGRRHRPLLRRQHAGRGAAHLERTRSTTRRCPSAWRSPTRASRALAADPHLRNGLNVHAGRITYRAVAESLNLDFADPESN